MSHWSIPEYLECRSRGGVAVASIHDHMRLREIDVLADLNPSSVLSFMSSWQKKRLYRTVSPCEAGWARTALVSRVPMQAYSFAPRHLAAVELRNNDCFKRLAVVSFYGVPHDVVVTPEPRPTP